MDIKCNVSTKKYAFYITVVEKVGTHYSGFIEVNTHHSELSTIKFKHQSSTVNSKISSVHNKR